MLAWLFARTTDRRFGIRIEDLDTARVDAAGGAVRRQLSDLAALGIDHDGDIAVQSDRLARYGRAVERLDTYECFCTRREIAEAASAPHADGSRPYPGTCRNLTEGERARKRAVRPPALRLRAQGATATVTDLFAGQVTGTVDDFVLVRGDGTYAYNLAVVVDDGEQGVDQVVRGDDLLWSAPRQAHLARLLGHAPPTYAHVPLAVNSAGQRLAKRDGAVTMTEFAAAGLTPTDVLSLIAVSLDLASPAEAVTLAMLKDRFDPARLPREPWVVSGQPWGEAKRMSTT